MLVQGFPNPVGSKQPVHSRNDVAKSLASDKQNSLQPIHFLCPCHSPSSPILMSYFNYSTPFPLLAITPALALVAVMLAAIVVNPVAAIVIGVAIVREEEELFGWRKSNRIPIWTSDCLCKSWRSGPRTWSVLPCTHPVALVPQRGPKSGVVVGVQTKLLYFSTGLYLFQPWSPPTVFMVSHFEQAVIIVIKAPADMIQWRKSVLSELQCRPFQGSHL